MTIGRHECKQARNTHLPQAIAIGLDEALTALEESFYDLSDAQVRDFPVPGENNIAWIVMHCLDNLDEYANGAQSGARVYPREWRWDLWQCAPDERPKPGDSFPSSAEMLDRLNRIRIAAFNALTGASEAALVAPVEHDLFKRTRADFYMRTIFHTMSHVRQVWLLRGALGLAQGPWPQQHWA